MNMFDFKEIIPPSGKWNKVEVKPSPNKGNGVFATKKIKKGEAICWYDGILCKIHNDDWTNIVPALISGKTGYNQNTSHNEVLAGTTKEFRKGGVASLINDYSTTNDINEIRMNMLNKKYNCDRQIKYDENGNFKSYMVIAERNINIGEELYVYYGVNYWTDTGKKWTDEDIKNIVHSQNTDYKQDHNNIQDYIDRAEIVKTLKKFWLD